MLSNKSNHSFSAFGPFASLSCGGAHVISITSHPVEECLHGGRGTSGQLGHGEMINCLQPNEVKALGGFVVTCVSAGWNHSGFVTGEEKLYMLGGVHHGALSNPHKTPLM